MGGPLAAEAVGVESREAEASELLGLGDNLPESVLEINLALIVKLLAPYSELEMADRFENNESVLEIDWVVVDLVEGSVGEVTDDQSVEVTVAGIAGRNAGQSVRQQSGSMGWDLADNLERQEELDLLEGRGVLEDVLKNLLEVALIESLLAHAVQVELLENMLGVCNTAGDGGECSAEVLDLTCGESISTLFKRAACGASLLSVRMTARSATTPLTKWPTPCNISMLSGWPVLERRSKSN